MRTSTLKVLTIEAIFLLVATILDFWLDIDLNLSNQLWSLASDPPPNGAFLFAFLAVFVGFHIDVIALWLGWGYQFYGAAR